MNILRELRLIVCGWCFAVALWIVPKDDPEGLIIIELIHDWAAKSASYLTSQFSGFKKKNR